MELKGTKTEKNLKKAFLGESGARNKYTYYASQAKKEGYEQIAAIFLETAENEKEHAKLWFKLLGGLGKTEENLLEAAAGEMEEWTEMYSIMAEEAREEGFVKIAELFEMVAQVERAHEQRYRALHELLVSGKLFKRDEVIVWKCRNCGFLHTGQEAPESCPSCSHPQGYFEPYHKIEK